VVPVVTFVVTIPLVLAGVGVWSLVIGAFAGNVAAVILSIRLSPYRLAFRYDPATARRYLAFSWPIFVVTLGGLITGQGQILAFKLEGGLAAAGFLALAVALTRYADRADQIISPAIYPAICAVRDRVATLEEMFVKSCRASAIWSVAFGAGFVLFAPDLVHFALGSKWDGAVLLLQGLGAAAAVYQLGFGWIAFARGMGRPRPPALEAVVAVAVFALVAIPALVLWGRGAYVGAMIGSSLAVLAVRAYFVRRLLPGVDLGRLLVRSVRPLVPAAAAVVTLRLALWGGQRHLGQAVCEVLLFLAVYLAATWASERPLIRELRQPAFQP
jgi:O-antigen/teichoic acid export membrane protein